MKALPFSLPLSFSLSLSLYVQVTVSAPFVKLIDFGFARMLEADDGEVPPEESKIIGT